MQRTKKVALTAALALVAMGSAACSVEIDQILAMQEGSGVDVALVLGGNEVPQGRLDLSGGAVMRIDMDISFFDLLFGSFEGTVEVLDVLFGSPGFNFLFIHTGLICVVPDDPAGGGTFEYSLWQHEAAFDVLVNTTGLLTNPFLAGLVRGGGFAFPFDLEATIPMSLLDALGLFSGSGSLSVTQALDGIFEVPIVVVPNDPSQDTIYTVHATGEVTLQSTDTFPATQLVLDCLDFLGT